MSHADSGIKTEKIKSRVSTAKKRDQIKIQDFYLPIERNKINTSFGNDGSSKSKKESDTQRARSTINASKTKKKIEKMDI